MIIFDLDGTLLDTVEDLAVAVNHALKKFGFKEKNIDETKRLLGNGIALLVAGAIENGEKNPKFCEAYEEFKKYYSTHLYDYTKPYDGIIELLEELKRKNIKMGIVSNKFDEGVKCLRKEFFADLIEYAQGISETVKRKPNPDAVFELIKLQKAQDEENIYVGDSEVDIETAKNAGLKCICVSWGFRSREQLIESGAEIIIDEPKELLKYI